MKRRTSILCLALVIGAAASSQAAAAFKNSPNGGLHQPSGVIFPERVGAFRRVGQPNFYDNTGRDVSVRYLLGRDIIADAYAYPVTRTTGGLDSEFRRQQNAISKVNRNVKLLRQENVSITQNGRAVAGRHAAYDLERPLFGSRSSKAGSHLYVFRDGNWFVAYRFSYPRERGAVATKQMSEFVARWQWKPGATRV